MRVHIGIYLEDRGFAGALAKALAEACSKFEFSLPVGRKLLDENKDKYDLVLMDEDSGAEEGGTIYLSDSADGACRGLDDVETAIRDSKSLRIFKYEKGSLIADYLIYYIFLSKGEMIENRTAQDFHVIGFTGISGRCGVTSAAISAAYMLEERYGEKCLYINLCPVNDSYRYFNSGGDQNLKKLIYYLRQERSGGFPVDGFIETDFAGPDYLKMPVINRFLAEINDEVCLELFKVFGETGKYDYLIVDLEPDLLCRSNVLSGYFHNVVAVERGLPGMQPGYAEEIEREIVTRTGASKVICVHNFVSGQDSDDLRGLEGSGAPGRVAVGYDRNAFIKGRGAVRIDLNRSYGRDIAVLTDKIRGVCHGDEALENLC